ncbi:hypothetical protein MAR_006764 [Mya arenaria]|uniref:Uncharacterized protein n=1 Tax=Mya arenaria TaxID=6604 RepID=A0ABY7DAJ4_MYAAR|nr:hypothetical protein MAR_006764 [Mya arenaria]
MIRLQLYILLATSICFKFAVDAGGITDEEGISVLPDEEVLHDLPDEELVSVFTDEDVLSVLRGQRGQYFCPGTDYCQVNTTGMEQQSEYCCRDCSCSEDCELNNNCCFREWRASEDETCVETAIVETHSYTPAYYMVTTCKPVTSSKSMDGEHIDCAEFNESSPWGPVNPVFSAETNRIYLNSLCAKCNGVIALEKLNPFTLKINCDLFDNTDLNMLVDNAISFINFNSYNNLKCDITVNAPADIRGKVFKKLCLEHRNIYSTCSPLRRIATSTSTHMTFELAEKLCKSNFFSPHIDSRSRVFKNVFCLLCNGDPWLGQGSCYSPELTKGNSIRQTFTLFLSPEKVAQLRTNEIKQYTQWKACADDSNAKNGSNCKPVLCPLGRLFTTDSKCSFISNYFSVQGLSIFLKIDLNIPILVHHNNSTSNYLSKKPTLLAKPFNVWRVKKAFYSVLKISQSVIEIRHLALYMEFKTLGPLNNVILDEIEDFMMGDVHIVIDNSKSLCSVEIFPCNIQRFNVEEKYNTNIDRWIEITDKPLSLTGYYALAEYHFCYLVQLCDLEIDLPIFLKTKVVIKQTGMVLYDYQFQYIEKNSTCYNDK